MQYALALLALAGAVMATPEPQGVTAVLTPTASAPAGCSPTYTGQFEITVAKAAASKRSLEERQASTCGQTGILTLTLADGVLNDALGRTGYIASNHQFQFDKPVQDGAIFTAGFSVCGNGSLALGGSTTFYECLSGSFYNLYDQSTGAQCEEVLIDIIPCSGSSTPSGTDSGSGSSAPTGTALPVTASADGQPAATSASAVSQTTDGQPQAGSATTVAAVSEFTDGQPQMPTAVAQATDGQIQFTTSGAPVSVSTDGQPEATAPATTLAAVSVSTDGQPEATAPATTLAAVSVFTDGQPQATAPAATITPYTGAANAITLGGSLAAMVAVCGAMVAL